MTWSETIRAQLDEDLVLADGLAAAEELRRRQAAKEQR